MFITRASSDLSAYENKRERTTTKHFIANATAMMLPEHASSLLLMYQLSKLLRVNFSYFSIVFQ
jgi:hypothetical protein